MRNLLIAGIALLTAALPVRALADGVLIAATERRGLAWDASRGLLYITTSDGKIQRYDPTSGSLLSAFTVGVELNGIAVTPDGDYAYVAEDTAGSTQGFFRKVDLASGTRTNVAYTQQGLESGAYDIAMTSHGIALTTTQFAGSGGVPLRSLDLSDDTFDELKTIRQNSRVYSSGDGRRVFITESNSSAGPIQLYDAVTGTTIVDANVWSSLSSTLSSINYNGTRIAMESDGLSIMDDDLNVVEILASQLNGGNAFNPVFNEFYAADGYTNEIVVFDTTTFQEKTRLTIGEDLFEYDWRGSAHFDAGEMLVSDNGRHLFLSTPQGVRMFSLSWLDLPLLAGDANNDGVIDADDYLAVELNFGAIGNPAGYLLGDANDDGRVDGDDLLAIERNFGKIYDAGPATPEPTSLGVLLAAAASFVIRRRL